MESEEDYRNKGKMNPCRAKIYSAKQHLEAAVKDLSEVVINKVDGTNDLKPAYFEVLNKNMGELIRIRESTV